MFEALMAELETIEDPRCEWKVEHRLVDVLVIAVCAVLGEAGPRASRTSPSTAAASEPGSRASSSCRTASPRTTPSGGS